MSAIASRAVALAKAHGPLIVVALAALRVASLLVPLFTGREPYGEDLSLHLAEVAQLSRSLRAGDFNFWSPIANLGFPSGYYYQVLPQLLPALLHAALGGRPVLLLPIFKLALAAPLVLLPITVYRGLLISGSQRWEAACGAVAATLVCSDSRWGLGGDSMWTSGIYTQAWAMLFYPLALGTSARWLVAGELRLPALVWSLLTGLCHPAIGVALAGPLALLALRNPKERIPRALLLLGAALAASAFFWLPVIVHHDSFGGFPTRSLEEAGLGPLALLKQLREGRIADSGRAPILTALAALGLVLAAFSGRGPPAWLALQLLFFCATLMLGTLLPARVAELVPGIRFLAPLQLALAGLAGQAFFKLLEGASSLRGKGVGGRIATGAVAALGAVLLALLLGGQTRAAAKLRMVDQVSSLRRGELDQVLDFLAAAPPGRVFAASELGTGSHWWMYLPSAYVDRPALRAYGGAALQSSALFVYLLPMPRGALLPLFGVRYVLIERALEPPGAHPVFQTATIDVLELAETTLFAPIQIFGSAPAERKARQRAVQEWLDSDAAEHGVHLALDGAGPTTPPAGRLLSETSGASWYSAEVEADAPTMFALKATWHPGWSARIDGAPAAIRRVSPDYPAVEIPAGRHQLELRFRRPWWTWVLLAVAPLIVLLARQKKHDALSANQQI